MYPIKKVLVSQRMDAVGSGIGGDCVEAIMISMVKFQVAVIENPCRHVCLTKLSIQMVEFHLPTRQTLTVFSFHHPLCLVYDLVISTDIPGIAGHNDLGGIGSLDVENCGLGHIFLTLTSVHSYFPCKIFVPGGAFIHLEQSIG